MVTKHTQKLIENYLTLTIWFMVHQNDKDIDLKQFEEVLKEIGQVEDSLREKGVTQTTIEKLLDYAQELYKTPIEQFSENAQLRLGKIILGAGTHWDKTPPTPKQSLEERKNSDAKAM
ncbi:MAG: hypothetical protein ACD_38C00169G0024 [uncultured bacterium]|nr:MAG: hypothetical protein ACD_38C00169G0024 [uncultured bacterium]OGE21172.1 MAG: hypothetical protein A2778_02490 [Candidatus Daviesbacteria bacterium RIFCSPHIGHO2_01_FULL_40_24]OGE28905.1 MAG: hypothetical protein A3C29_03575 [Candidatus Daviesbacteria bacterium RIFCSPHIGHO2_02_FULL_40_16]OGE42171.1 MAG: hypothetical protein A3A53_03545 [Candidatus Daviesbacteria bacterium RIFCSPLOWO2_01_FULL_39_23]OGE66289.1 MAG: hypothetical protein A3J16_00135 [Candidatus Daviesbacteria bacterium RIFCSP